MAGFVLRHRSITPYQYVSGDPVPETSHWITTEYSKATTFPSEEMARMFRQQVIPEFASLFEIVPKLEVV